MEYLTYLRETNDCILQANEIIKKANEYKEYSDNVLSVSKSISTVADDLSSAQNSFITGGYVCCDEGLYQNVILMCQNNADSISSSLNNLSDKTLSLINELKVKYNMLKSSYEFAKMRFYACEIKIGNVLPFPSFPMF